eukprot:m.116611 g.116611  ORF g.116611 m.116611 type:complete len:66 (+) comp51946_c0_seq3:83-280(+)
MSEGSLWARYTALPARTRLVFGLTMMSVSLVGMYVADILEQPAAIQPVSKQPTSTPRASSGTPPQ